MGSESFQTEQELAREEAHAIVRAVLGQLHPTRTAYKEATKLAEQFGFEAELDDLMSDLEAAPGSSVDANRKAVRRLKKDGVGPGSRALYGDIEVEVTGFTPSKVWVKHVQPPRLKYKVDPHALKIEQS